MAIRPESMEKLTAAVKKYNPDLMIISDDVYGTFVDDFKSVVSYLPFNTIGVYSFSKYFGVTGWRLGTISLAGQNVFDHLLEALPKHEKESARRRKRELFESLGLNLTEDPYSASYYTEFDILELSENFYGEEFARYLKVNCKPADIGHSNSN